MIDQPEVGALVIASAGSEARAEEAIQLRAETDNNIVCLDLYSWVRRHKGRVEGVVPGGGGRIVVRVEVGDACHLQLTSSLAAAYIPYRNHANANVLRGVVVR